MGSATVTLDSTNSTEEANDSLTVGFISKGAVYGNQGDDSMVVSGNALSASLYGGNRQLPDGFDDIWSGRRCSGADTFRLSDSLKGASLYGGDGGDLMSVAGGISAGAVYGNTGDDSFVLQASTKPLYLVVQVMTPRPSTELSHPREGGLDADSLIVSGALTSLTVYGENSSATAGGAIRFQSVVMHPAVSSMPMSAMTGFPWLQV